MSTPEEQVVILMLCLQRMKSVITVVQKEKVMTILSQWERNRGVSLSQCEHYQSPVVNSRLSGRWFHLGEELSAWLLVDKEMFECSFCSCTHQNSNIIKE